MRQEAWHEEEYKGYSIKLFQDEDSESPRDWDNLGHMICFHPNYDLGDKHNMTPEELLELVKRKDVLALPLVLLDHSGLWMKVGSGWAEDPGGWDTSRVGFIYVTYEEIRKEMARPKHYARKINPDLKEIKRVSKYDLMRAENSLRAEVATYSDYLEGNVVGFVVEDKDGEIIDSVWGYYGDEGQKDAIQCAKDAIDYRVPEDLWKAQKVGGQMEMFAG